MAFSFDEEYIKNFLGDIVYNGGRDMYLRNKIRKVDILENSENTFSITSTVESAYDLKDYKVNILTNTKNGAMYCACNCDSYKSNRKCKHIAAVLIKMSREGIKGKFFKENILVNGVELLQYYKENLVKNYKENQLINLEVRLEIIDRDYKNYSIELKVGVDKLYIIKNIKEFIESIFLNKQIIEFGKELTFDPNIFTFQFVRYEWEYKTAKIASSANTSYKDIRCYAHFFELVFGFKTDYRLVQNNMVQDTSKTIFRFTTAFYCFFDSAG